MRCRRRESARETREQGSREEGRVTATTERERMVYRGEALAGGRDAARRLGTGTIALAGDGSLRQWQIHNQVNHLGLVPHTFFAVWTAAIGPGTPIPRRVLQSAALYDHRGAARAADLERPRRSDRRTAQLLEEDARRRGDRAIPASTRSRSCAYHDPDAAGGGPTRSLQPLHPARTPRTPRCRRSCST